MGVLGLIHMQYLEASCSYHSNESLRGQGKVKQLALILLCM
jgi:hypothetical protein